jgi:hypothetical protein
MLALTLPNGVQWRPLGFNHPESTRSQLNKLSDPSAVPFTHHYIADETKIVKGTAITLHNEISHTDL